METYSLTFREYNSLSYEIKGGIYDDLIYNFIINGIFIGNFCCTRGSHRGDSGGNTIWRCDYMYCNNNIYR